MPVDIDIIRAGNTHALVKESMYDMDLAPKFEQLLQSAGLTPESLTTVVFEPEKHLRYYAMDEETRAKFDATRTLSMEDLGLSHPEQVSPVGVSDPFPMFTDAAVAIMKAEILQKQLFLKFARYTAQSTSGMDCVIRGYVKKNSDVYTPFVHQAWTHPKTVELISKVAGVELEIIMDYEIAHVNMGLKSATEAESEIIQATQADAKLGLTNGEDIPAIVGWHYDLYPFVCVLMLSDTTTMIGGETSLRLGGEQKGKVVSIPGPQLGYASVLQGRLIEHIAPKPLGSSERITMVTSYRAKNPLKHEGSVLRTVKPEINNGTRFHDFYPEWIKYRFEIMQQRMKHLEEKMVDSKGDFDKEFCMDYLSELQSYLDHTRSEMIVTEEEAARHK